MSSKIKPRVGYVTRRFPSISETFVMNEILQIEALGRRVEIYAVLQPRDPRFHSGITRLNASIRYVPGITDLKSLWRYNRMAQKRFGKRYWQVFFWALTRLRPMLVWRFFLGAFVAERAVASKITHFHAHFANRSTTVARMAGKLSGIPYSLTAHAVDIFKEPLNRKVLENMIADAKVVVTVSDSNKAYLEGFSRGQPDKIRRVYNGIDFDAFSPGEVERGARFSILCIARFVEKKGLDRLIDACRIVKDAGLDFECNIIGKGMMRAALVEQINANGLQDNVRLLGVHTQEEIIERHRASDLFVLPCVVGKDGNRDGLPVSIVEALAVGVPVIATPVSGIPEAVEHEVNGLIVPEDDVPALAEAMEMLMRDDAHRAKLAAAARGSVIDRFDHRAAAATLDAIFTDAD